MLRGKKATDLLYLTVNISEFGVGKICAVKLILFPVSLIAPKLTFWHFRRRLKVNGEGEKPSLI